MVQRGQSHAHTTGEGSRSAQEQEESGPIHGQLLACCMNVGVRNDMPVSNSRRISFSFMLAGLPGKPILADKGPQRIDA